MCVCVCVSVYTCVRVYVQVYVCVCEHVYVGACVCVHIHMQMHTHICTYISVRESSDEMFTNIHHVHLFYDPTQLAESPMQKCIYGR